MSFFSFRFGGADLFHTASIFSPAAVAVTQLTLQTTWQLPEWRNRWWTWPFSHKGSPLQNPFRGSRGAFSTSGAGGCRISISQETQPFAGAARPQNRWNLEDRTDSHPIPEQDNWINSSYANLESLLLRRLDANSSLASGPWMNLNI